MEISYVNIRNFPDVARGHICGMGRPVLFKCPQTGMHVQHWLPDAVDDEPKGSYRQIVCPACAGLHFINYETGKLLGENNVR